MCFSFVENPKIFLIPNSIFARNVHKKRRISKTQQSPIRNCGDFLSKNDMVSDWMTYRDDIIWGTIDHLEKLQYESRWNTGAFFAARGILLSGLSVLGGGVAHVVLNNGLCFLFFLWERRAVTSLEGRFLARHFQLLPTSTYVKCTYSNTIRDEILRLRAILYKIKKTTTGESSAIFMSS